MARDDPHFRLRLPADLKREIEQAAEQAGRSINAEIVNRLTSVQEKQKSLDEAMSLLNMIGSLIQMLEKLAENKEDMAFGLALNVRAAARIILRFKDQLTDDERAHWQDWLDNSENFIKRLNPLEKKDRAADVFAQRLQEILDGRSGPTS
jgi:hypothetical protein